MQVPLRVVCKTPTMSIIDIGVLRRAACVVGREMCKMVHMAAISMCGLGLGRVAPYKSDPAGRGAPHMCKTPTKLVGL